MRKILWACCCTSFALLSGGCGGPASHSTMSRIVTTESAEFKAGKAAQDEFERRARESERKTLGQVIDD
jgi:hypothetical protein